MPKLSEELSEFIGALAGDGHLYSNKFGIAITCHKVLDKDYIYYLDGLFQNLFKEKSIISFQKNVMKLTFFSKSLVEKLNRNYNLPMGKKMNNLHIPSQILSNENFLAAYIRGLFDTDGTFCRHHKKNSAMIEIVSGDKNFLKEINSALKFLNFKTSIGYKGVRIYDQKEIDKFFDIINSSNPKHKFKYETFKKEGFVPLTKDLLMRG